MSAKDYPEHLNPFDDNYTGTVEASTSHSHSQHKYNTWSAPRSHRVTTTTLVKRKPSFLEKPWAALNISPNGKLVRRLSILKTSVEKFATKKKRLFHSSSFTDVDLPPRSNSVHDDFSFRIISPKLKEKIRQQAFSQSINNQPQPEDNPHLNTPNSPQLNGRLSPPSPETEEPLKLDSPIPATPESEKEVNLGTRPKTRKKRPPPPPPIEALKITHIVPLLQIVEPEKSEDSHSANSSITQDLEKDAMSEEENSKTDVFETIKKETDENV